MSMKIDIRNIMSIEERIEQILTYPDQTLPALLPFIAEIDCRLCKSLIYLMFDKESALKEYPIKRWTRTYSLDVTKKKLECILRAGAMSMPSVEFFMAQQCFQNNDFEGSKNWLHKASAKGDPNAQQFLKFLQKTSKNTFRVAAAASSEKQSPNL